MKAMKNIAVVAALMHLSAVGATRIGAARDQVSLEGSEQQLVSAPLDSAFLQTET